MSRRTVVYGPAYLDRVLLVDRPLLDPKNGGPLDQSVEGRPEFGEGLRVIDPNGSEISVELPADWPGPSGVVRTTAPLPGQPVPWHATAEAVSWHDDLGGMGAGYAAAFGGTLVSALGPEQDATSRKVSSLLRHAGVDHRPMRIADRPADWTLLLTSGGFGDKLPIGFRGCHEAIRSLEYQADQTCDLSVVASLPNRLASQALRASRAGLRFFAPAMRNMRDRDCPVSGFVEFIDVLCCNRHEWETLEDRENVAWQVSLLAITDGGAGSRIRFTTPSGDPGQIDVPAFPRRRPPRDTNRAGEAYASTLVNTVLDAGWEGGVVEEELVRRAGARATVAAALVLDFERFGFPADDAIDEALSVGEVA